MTDLDLRYASLRLLIAPYQARARTESRAFLAWYLENVYRLEPSSAQDAVCDGSDDKGIDGIYVDSMYSRVDVFQATVAQNDAKKIGDVQVKKLVGTLEQFATADAVEAVARTTRNPELRQILEDEDYPVAQLVRDGWEVRGVFVTNAAADPSAIAYLESCGANIVLADREAIGESYVPSGHPAIVSHPVSFDVFGYDVAKYLVGNATVVVAPLRATELVNMRGIQSGGLFDYNVRQLLGKTSVNKDIVKSVKNQREHAHFLLYHNGITIVAESVDTETEGRITIDNYVVVNGCQSLSVFRDRSSDLSDDLRVLARVIQIDRSSPLMGLITHHSNNQNGIKPRDFQSNNPIQIRLRNEFEAKFKDRIFYRISRGEESGLPEVIDNELAARILLAFDLREPWTSHQTYKLFDDLHSRIFARPEVNAERIVALQDVYDVVDAQLRDGELRDELLAKYTLTKFYLLYLTAGVLEDDAIGREFIRDPAPFIQEANGRDRLRRCVDSVLYNLIVDLKAEVEERNEAGKPFDFKKDLKSADAARSLAVEIRAGYKKAARRGHVDTFENLWRESSNLPNSLV